jgi:hypothetical protein
MEYQCLSSAPTLTSKIAADLLGTFVFVLVGAGSALGTASLSGPNSGATHWGGTDLEWTVECLVGNSHRSASHLVLVMVVYGTAVDRRAPHIGGIGIGLAVLADDWGAT